MSIIVRNFRINKIHFLNIHVVSPRIRACGHPNLSVDDEHLMEVCAKKRGCCLIFPDYESPQQPPRILRTRSFFPRKEMTCYYDIHVSREWEYFSRLCIFYAALRTSFAAINFMFRMVTLPDTRLHKMTVWEYETRMKKRGLGNWR